MRFIYLLSGSILLSCCQSVVTRDALQDYVNDGANNLLRSSETAGISMAISYRPTDMLVSQELGDGQADLATVESLRNKFSSYYYFVLSISYKGREALHYAGGGEQYDELLRTMSFRMADHIVMTTSGNDTIPVAASMLDRTYNLAVSTNMLLAFRKPPDADAVSWVQLNVREFGARVGDHRFRYQVKDMSAAPLLDLVTDSSM